MSVVALMVGADDAVRGVGALRGTGDRQKLFSYATEQEAPSYRAVMDVFLAAAAGYRSRLRPEDVAAGLANAADAVRLDAETIRRRLDQLYEWGNLHRDRDESRAVDLASYERRSYVYDLSHEGEAAHEALIALEEGLRRAGGLQTVMLRQILTLLHDLVELVGADSVDGSQLYVRVEELHRSFRTLTGNAGVFMQKVNRILRSSILAVADFQVFKADTVAYLTGFIRELGEFAEQIRDRLATLAGLGEPVLHAALLTAARASGERALDGTDAETVWVQIAERRLAGVDEWFRPASGSAAGAPVLQTAVRTAVLEITRTVERIREARLAPSSRSSDLLTLAGWFEAAPDDAAAHRLWHASFALGSARHLTHPGELDVPATVSWWDAPTADFPVRLRRTTTGDHVRRASRVPDHRASRDQVARRVRAAQEVADRAAADLVALGQLPMSALPDILDDACLDLLADLVARAEKRAPRPDGWRRARSVDGRLRIRLRDPRGRHGASVVTVRGRWTVRDYEFEVTWSRAGVVSEPSRSPGPLGAVRGEVTR